MPTNQFAPSMEPAVPIGGVIPHEKDKNGADSVPDRFVECNGQTINDADSPMDGETVPDLNGTNRFLRGNTASGAEGGAEQVTISSSELASHRHHIYAGNHNEAGDNMSKNASDGWESENRYTNYEGSDSAHENRPPFHDTVYIMRIK